MLVSQIKEYAELLTLFVTMIAAVLTAIYKAFKNTKSAITDLISDNLKPLVQSNSQILSILAEQHSSIVKVDDEVEALKSKVESLHNNHLNNVSDIRDIVYRLDRLTDLKKIA
jgi:predicted PurR-regulated permease PerM